mgnify:CR=1 FL=1
MMLRFASTAAVAHASILPENQWGSFEDGLSLLQMKKSAVVDPGNPNCFIAGDGTSTAGEILLGDAADKQGCLDMVWAARNDGRCPLANGATLHPSGVGPCYCENGWTGTSGSNGWITCGTLAPEPPMFPKGPSCFVAGDGTSTNGEILLGNAASKQACLDMVVAAKTPDGRCPLATGATMDPSGVGPCYCENGWTGTSGSNGWITCGKHIADEALAEGEAEAVGDPHITTITGHTFDMGQ